MISEVFFHSNTQGSLIFSNVMLSSRWGLIMVLMICRNWTNRILLQTDMVENRLLEGYRRYMFLVSQLLCIQQTVRFTYEGLCACSSYILKSATSALYRWPNSFGEGKSDQCGKATCPVMSVLPTPSLMQHLKVTWKQKPKPKSHSSDFFVIWCGHVMKFWPMGCKWN